MLATSKSVLFRGRYQLLTISTDDPILFLSPEPTIDPWHCSSLRFLILFYFQILDIILLWDPWHSSSSRSLTFFFFQILDILFYFQILNVVLFWDPWRYSTSRSLALLFFQILDMLFYFQILDIILLPDLLYLFCLHILDILSQLIGHGQIS